MRKPKDRDFLETAEGLFFCVVGYLHPPDAFTAYLKYRPGSRGRWERGGVRYVRMMDAYSAANMKSSSEWLRSQFPHYLARCRVRGIELPLVPRGRVVRYYMPEVRLMELMGGPRDPLEHRVCQLVDLLSGESRVPASCFGITGSILLNIHNPSFSDIDLVVFGARNARRVARAAKRLLDEGQLEPYTEREITVWKRRQARLFDLPKEYVERLVWPSWSRGRIEGTPYSLLPVRTDEEISEEYEEERFKALGVVELTATVSGDDESLFIPAIYDVKDVTLHQGPKRTPPITKVVSFEGVFAGCARRGQHIRVRGTLEEVRDRRRRILRYQVVIGTFTSRGWLIPV